MRENPEIRLLSLVTQVAVYICSFLFSPTSGFTYNFSLSNIFYFAVIALAYTLMPCASVQSFNESLKSK